MPEPKPKAKNLPLQQRLIEDAREFGTQAFQRIFGLAQGWEKHRDIVQNNYDLGCRHLALGNIRDAVARFKAVTWLSPKHADGWFRLGCAYLAENKRDLAKDALKRSLTLKPGSEEAEYMMAIAGGSDTPVERLPKKMPLMLVREHFDQQAAAFTEAQLNTYHYQGYTLLAGALRARLMQGRMDYVILDLGVGSGLCGSQLRDVASQLTGVDISAPMLQQAMKLEDSEDKKIYNVLVNREALDFLREAPAASYDIIIAAELFSYIGDVSDIFQQAARVLKPGGFLAFTADKMEGAQFRLDPAAGRFLFSKSWLEKQAAANQFRIITCEEAPLYPEYKGWLCIFAKE